MELLEGANLRGEEPDGEVADGELGEALEAGDLDEYGAGGGPGRHHGELELPERPHPAEHGPGDPGRGDLELQALEPVQVPGLRGQHLDVVAEELERPEPPAALADGARDEVVCVAVDVELAAAERGGRRREGGEVPRVAGDVGGVGSARR